MRIYNNSVNIPYMDKTIKSLLNCTYDLLILISLFDSNLESTLCE